MKGDVEERLGGEVVPLGWEAGVRLRERSERSGGSGTRPVGEKGVVDVGERLMWCSMRVGTVFGVTFSMMVKEGRRRMVVGSEGEWWWCGVGMLEAESMSF